MHIANFPDSAVGKALGIGKCFEFAVLLIESLRVLFNSGAEFTKSQKIIEVQV